MTERELTEPVSLTLPDGRLNPAAVGWARHPIVDTSGIGPGARGRGRNKRWEYWNVITPTHILALTVSSIDYAAVHGVWIFDCATQRSWSRDTTVIPARGVEVPGVLGAGPARARAKGLRIDIDTDAETTRLRAEIPDASFDVTVHRPDGHECLAVVVPFRNPARFQYTVKDLALPASGTVTVDGVTHAVPAGASWAVLDHGRGRWPYDVRWNWGAGSGVSEGRILGLQVGGQWTDGTGVTENGVIIDGRLHKIHDELRWDYDLTDPLRPWRVTGGGLDATLEPFYDKRSATNLGVLSSRTDQCFGRWSGTFRTDEAAVSFDGIDGWAEDVHNRW
ncbi:MAG: DUF2804 domain-containing protein [Microbacterium sp.]|uniref:DUF2804 domain-containing protein n=1 Tax=Microbacterium sp. TaxID=51671 RepID=UPI002635831E|nr:DUF2804 domain-containing protein [Microbacterium sp.]MCX6503294.1 DUF2804 domain-containing protein [Microbacterium sp.]